MEANAPLRQTPPPPPPPPPPLPPVKPQGVTFRHSDDTWYSENEDDLLDIWHTLQDIIKSRGIVMLDKCRFNHFCAFVVSMTTTPRDNCI
ncbi:EsV-1-61 [Ectocarpus siliculosus]|uniref:EsV-1-61 n=1 Tax=Ectocarpus siliculosus TaxID=2880 RepID=D8LP94_ECTSI|nr:EsV-1-61 [Ectocarpus siliculosus]|eukprot:CBN80365.1 EsV-1-61 [Ectocarpus siliculosus]